MDVIKKILDLTAERGWSLYQLSFEADIGQSTLSNMISRGTMPSITTLKKICHAFDITLSQFFDETDSKNELSPQEKELLCLFRNLPETKRKCLLDFIR